MRIESLESLFLFAYIVEAILQIRMIHRYRKNNNTKDKHNFLGINIIVFICNIVSYEFFAESAIGLSSALLGVFTCGFILVTNFILFIIGLIIIISKKNVTSEGNKTNDKKENKIIHFRSSIIVLICNVFIIIILPIITQQIISKIGEIKVINYLNNKYGNGNYEVVDFAEEYINVGMWDKSLSGYFYDIKSDYMKDTFRVCIDDSFSYIEDDYFLPVYYSEKYQLPYNQNSWHGFDEFEEYVINKIKEKYSIDTNKLKISDLYNDYVRSYNMIDGPTYNTGYYIVDENYGRIPSIDELIDLLIKNYNETYQNSIK